MEEKDNSAPVPNAPVNSTYPIVLGIASFILTVALGLIGLVLSVFVSIAVAFAADRRVVTQTALASLVGGILGFVVLMAFIL